MPIQIIDGFQVNTASPIDTRIVASGSAARNAIQNKYHGLRVFDISNNIPYVWNGTTWISENSTGINGSGTINYIPRFTSSNILGNSIFYQDGDSLKTEDTGGGNALVQIDSYNGSVTALSFIGNGSNLSNINGLNINPGSIPLSRLTNGSTGWLLSGASPNPIYVNPTQITVGTASVATQSTITNTTSNTNNFITFVSSSSGNSQIRVNSSGLLYNPSTNVLSTGAVSVNGVRFPATQVASSDPNTLDDYEEGTWVPVISGVTSGFTYTSNGFYTKVGKIMFIGGYIKYTSAFPTGVIGSDNNFISISNIPYQSGVPIQNASVGSWSINPSTGTVQNRFFNTAGASTMDNGVVISSYQASGGTNIYFSSTSGLNPLSGGAFNQVVSFSLTFIGI